jgi:hypothetical protein
MAAEELAPEERIELENPLSPESTVNAKDEQDSGETVAVSPPSGPESPKHFPGELPLPFQEVLEGVRKRNRKGFSLLVFTLQPVLGALSHYVKVDVERAVGNPSYFTAPMATGLNILLNLLAYPVLLMLLAVGWDGVDVLFSQRINGFILLGFLLGFAEGVYRLKEGIFQARPPEGMIFRGSFYGFPLSGIVRPLLTGHSGIVRGLPVPVEGFYGKEFVDKLERERRYGHAYTVEDWGEAYHLRIEFPRKVPEIGLPGRSELPDEMPDYDYDLFLKDGHFIIKGRCTDEKVRKMSGSVGAFPAEFTTVIPLRERVEGFSHHCKNKVLEVLLLKEKAEYLQGTRA